MHVSRREALAGFAALLALPSSVAYAVALSPEAARFRDAMLGFDVRELLARIAADVGLPARWVRELDALLEEVEPGGGVRRLQELAEDEAFVASATALQERAQRSLALKLRVRRMIRDAPLTAEGLAPWIERAAGWLGIDLPAMRAATAALPEGLLVIVGPPTSAPEILWSLCREPFVRWLELLHGRRAKAWVAGMPFDGLLRDLLDPAVRVVCVVGHGTWGGVSMAGFPGAPEAMYRKLVRRLKLDPRATVPQLLSSSRWGLGLGWTDVPLEEADLAELVHAWFPDPMQRSAASKDLVVRYTCGSGRWTVEPALARSLMPAHLRARLDLDQGLAPARPGMDPASWQEPLAEWLAGREIRLEPVAAFGTCLVRDPANTRGYDGISWLPDFLIDPIPAPTIRWDPSLLRPPTEE